MLSRASPPLPPPRWGGRSCRKQYRDRSLHYGAPVPSPSTLRRSSALPLRSRRLNKWAALSSLQAPSALSLRRLAHRGTFVSLRVVLSRVSPPFPPLGGRICQKQYRCRSPPALLRSFRTSAAWPPLEKMGGGHFATGSSRSVAPSAV